MKKTIILLLALAMVFMFSTVALAASLGNFTHRNAYQAGQFGDVDDNAWYAENVATAYELGLMKGTGDNFNVSGNMSIAETIAISARIHSIYYTGSESFTQGNPWYQVYVNYALTNGIIKSAYTDYTKAATRAEFASILCNALPDSALQAINTITDNEIPDVPLSATYAVAVYKLYRAGVLTGNDIQGTFTPNANINRCAAAAIVTRMVDLNLRKTVDLNNDNQPTYTLTASDNQITMGIGESVTVYITTNGANLVFDIETAGVASAQWTAFENGEASLKITGLQEGFTWVRVDLQETDLSVYIGVTVEADYTLSTSQPWVTLDVGESTTVEITTNGANLAFNIETAGVASAQWTAFENDVASLKITGLQEGFTWIRVELQGTGLYIYIGVTVEAEEEIYLNASTNYVSVNVGESETVTISTNQPGAVLSFDTNVYTSSSWVSFVDGVATLRITGVQSTGMGTTWIRIDLQGTGLYVYISVKVN
jgi:hypothetical protein